MGLQTGRGLPPVGERVPGASVMVLALFAGVQDEAFLVPL